MASRIDQNVTEFEITYEAPWGGINADMDASDIQLNQLVEICGYRIKQNVLATSQFNISSTINFTHPIANNWYVGITSLNGVIVLFDNAGNILQYDPGANVVNLITGSAIQQFSAWKAINGYIYISDFLGGAIYQYQPTSNTTGVLTSAYFYVGGKYAAVLVNYLLIANSNMLSDTPAVKPARVSWSVPDSYTAFDPNADRTAGYNVLGDVQDQITGLFIQGNVGYILRTQGITQFTPTGDPLAPFSFTPLWSDDFGIGCDFPDTLSTYGPMALFANNTGVYNFAGAVADVAYGIKNYLQTDLNKALLSEYGVTTYISGTIHGAALSDRAPDIKYSLLTASIDRSLTLQSIIEDNVYTYNVHEKTWTRQKVDVQALAGSVYPGLEGIITALNQYKIFRAPRVEIVRHGTTNSFYVSTRYVPYILVSGVYATQNFNFVLQLYDEDAANNYQLASSSLIFKAHEFKLGRKPTVARILIKAQGTGTLAVTVTTTQRTGNTVQTNVKTFTPIILNSNIVSVYSSSGEVTGENPQLTITSTNFVGTIVKVLMKGTFADGDIL